MTNPGVEWWGRSHNSHYGEGGGVGEGVFSARSPAPCTGISDVSSVSDLINHVSMI